MEPYRLEALETVKTVREHHSSTLRGSLIIIAENLGFKKGGYDELDGWRNCFAWLEHNRISLRMVKGPHAITILKAIAVKHGRKSVSTGQ